MSVLFNECTYKIPGFINKKEMDRMLLAPKSYGVQECDARMLHAYSFVGFIIIHFN